MAGIEYLLSLSYSSLAPYIHCWGVFGHNFAKEGQQNKTRFAHTIFSLLLLLVVAIDSFIFFWNVSRPSDQVENSRQDNSQHRCTHTYPYESIRTDRYCSAICIRVFFFFSPTTSSPLIGDFFFLGWHLSKQFLFSSFYVTKFLNYGNFSLNSFLNKKKK